MKRTLGISILTLCILAAAGCASGLTLTIDKDVFGTFQPFNNQYRPMGDTKFRSGVLIQVSDFVDALHSYDWIKLYGSERAPVQTILRGDAEWIDIECGVTDQKPIGPDQAALLSPDPNHPNRRLHADIMYSSGQLIPITLWEPETGLKIETSFSLAPGVPVHGHQGFVLSSDSNCSVRVWKTLAAVTNTYAPGEIRRILVGEDAPPTTHGGVHSPPWYN